MNVNIDFLEVVQRIGLDDVQVRIGGKGYPAYDTTHKQLSDILHPEVKQMIVELGPLEHLYVHTKFPSHIQDIDSDLARFERDGVLYVTYEQDIPVTGYLPRLGASPLLIIDNSSAQVLFEGGIGD